MDTFERRLDTEIENGRRTRYIADIQNGYVSPFLVGQLNFLVPHVYHGMVQAESSATGIRFC